MIAFEFVTDISIIEKANLYRFFAIAVKKKKIATFILPCPLFRFSLQKEDKEKLTLEVATQATHEKERERQKERKLT
jgi:hypothetical protein